MNKEICKRCVGSRKRRIGDEWNEIDEREWFITGKVFCPHLPFNIRHSISCMTDTPPLLCKYKLEHMVLK